jgi:glucokinase
MGHLERAPESDSKLPAYAIGLDVGGTKIACGIVAFPSGNVLSRQTIPTFASNGGEAVLSRALQLAGELIQEAARSRFGILGIGVGVCELVNADGRITSGQAVAWQGLRVQERFSELAPAVVESDVRAAALAEARFGAGSPFKVFAYLTVGTGISHTLVQNGRAYAGARGNALVLASAPWTMTCTRCGEELNQVLEEFASGPALVARYNARSGRRTTRAEEVIEAAQAGDTAAGDVLTTAGKALGNSVGFLINILDPEAIVVGGGLGLAGGPYWSSFEDATRRHVWSESARDLPIFPAMLGTDAGLIGAASRAWQHFGV